ncbi:MAG TPA: hypothetical protein VFM58_05900 [Solirubrobacteraceae bacterium]|nr:hypothetical protein [Solirubrobacteraceae bacterium]
MSVLPRRLGVVTALAVAGVIASPSPAGAEGTLAYVSVPTWQVPFTVTPWRPYEPGRHVRTIGSDGRHAARMLNANTQSPAWSPSGSRIAYYRQSPRTGRAGIWTARADGSHARKLFAPKQGGADHPTWSPDGKTIAFERAVWRGDDLVTDIWRIGLNRHALRRITRTRAEELMPSWGPDGRIAFAREDARGDWNLYAVDPVSRAETQLTAGPERDLDPDWSSDGTRLAFSRETADRIDVWTVTAAGTDPHRVTASGPEEAASDPAWGPGDTDIAYAGWGPYGNDHELLVIGAGGGTPRQLTSNKQDDLAPDWRAP